MSDYFQYALTQRTFAVAGGCAEEDEHTLEACIAAETVTQHLLQELRFLLIAVGDLHHEAFKPFAARNGVVFHIAVLGQLVLWSVRSELHGFQMQGAVFAVEDVGIRIEFFHTNGMYAHCIRDYRFAHFTRLPTVAELGIFLAALIILDG